MYYISQPLLCDLYNTLEAVHMHFIQNLKPL